MSFLRRSCAVLALCTAAAQAQTIEFWHSNTAWAGQGMCAATFTFDSGGEPVSNLRVALSVFDKAGSNIDTIMLNVPEFGGSNAERYATEFWESDTACEDDLTLVVTSASANINEKRQDLLRTQKLVLQQFKPFKIQVGGAAPVPVAASEQQALPGGVQCDVELEPAQAESIWQQMQTDPKGYVQQCTESMAQMAVEFGGELPTKARAEVPSVFRLPKGVVHATSFSFAC
ncbi:IrmA family protein [Neopusillimonas aromaticivorans]|uniref:IrmA family protein n=1 Tax=Neopusillimonas aromaticivorans TaxID=2979868 RepID=UPI002599C7A0|nr:IrmA family protein [Neopusillimonas aromaticivorans]WJJ92966.1 IrmA family protein [Neopusillimonas aromaticivorans]